MAYFKILTLLSLLSLSASEPPYRGYQDSISAPSTSYLPPRSDYTPTSYLPPTYPGHSFDHGNGHHGNGHHGNGHHGNGDHQTNDPHHHNENEVPKSYEFGYSVKDIKSGNDYDRREVSDGNVVRGEYRVQLPDGRTQIVTYHADWLTGYHADVRYEGEAKYPEPSSQGYNYNAPAFGGSLSGFQSLPSPSYGPPGYH